MIPQNPKLSPMPLEEPDLAPTEPETNPPQTVEPPLVEPEPPQLDERQLAEIAEPNARVFLATNHERIAHVKN